MRRSIWRTLGIAPTSESSAIRRAYAQRLKGMDVDADTQGFMALREARDEALERARAGDVVDDDDASETHDIRVAPDEVETRAGAAAPDALTIHHEMLARLLFHERGGSKPLDWADQAKLVAHFDALMSDPRLEELAFFEGAASWFADAIAHNAPRSDALIERAITRFGWSRKDEIGRPPAVAHVIARANAIDFVAALNKPDHRLHSAWRELTKPATENSSRGWVSRRRVTELLGLVRERHPAVESMMDWYRVSLWENRSQGRWPRGGTWAVAIFTIQLLAAVARMMGDDASPPREAPASERSADPGPSRREDPAPALVSETPDIDRALERSLSNALNSADLKSGNPALWRLLETNWRIARDENRTVAAFDQNVRDVIDDRFEHALATSSYSVIADYRRLDLLGLQEARGQGAAACVAYIDGKRAMSRTLRSRLQPDYRALIAHALLEADVSVSTPIDRATHSFSIKAAVVEETARRAHLATDRLRQALRDEGTADERCDAHIALVETALALPQDEGRKLLHEL